MERLKWVFSKKCSSKIWEGGGVFEVRFKKIDSFTLETSRNQLLHKFLRNGRVRVKIILHSEFGFSSKNGDSFRKFQWTRTLTYWKNKSRRNFGTRDGLIICDVGEEVSWKLNLGLTRHRETRNKLKQSKNESQLINKINLSRHSALSWKNISSYNSLQ